MIGSEVSRIVRSGPGQMAAPFGLWLTKSPNFSPKTFPVGSPCLQRSLTGMRQIKGYRNTKVSTKRAVIVCGLVDPWAPTIDSQSIASQLFAFSLFPYIGFLYFITKSKSAPKLTLFGFYFLLAFVGATIPAGIYAKVHYGTSLSNVDWLHGGAESFLTLTNLFIVLGLREGLRKAQSSEQNTSTPNSGSK